MPTQALADSREAAEKWEAQAQGSLAQLERLKDLLEESALWRGGSAQGSAGLPGPGSCAAVPGGGGTSLGSAGLPSPGSGGTVSGSRGTVAASNSSNGPVPGSTGDGNGQSGTALGTGSGEGETSANGHTMQKKQEPGLAELEQQYMQVQEVTAVT